MKKRACTCLQILICCYIRLALMKINKYKDVFYVKINAWNS